MKKKIVALVGILACMSVAACAKTQTEDGTSQSKTEGDTKETQESTTKKEDTIYNIGDNVSLKDWGITVTEFKVVDSIAADYGSFTPKEEGNKYAQLFVTVANNGKEADNFLPTVGMGDDVSVKLLYGDGYEFTASNLLGYSEDLHDSHINPLSSKNGEIAFAIPDSVASAADEILIQFKSKNDIIKIKVR